MGVQVPPRPGIIMIAVIGMESEIRKSAKGKIRTRRSCIIGCALATTVFSVLIILLSLLEPLALVSHEVQYFDLNSGRQRIIKSLLFVKFSDEIKVGCLAKLYKEHYGEYQDPCWVLSNTFRLIGPRIAFHSGYGEMPSIDGQTELYLKSEPCADDLEILILTYTLWGSKSCGRPYSPLIPIYEYFREPPLKYPLDSTRFPPDSYLLKSGRLADIKNPMTPRAYGLDRFPELMQKIPPPH